MLSEEGFQVWLIILSVVQFLFIYFVCMSLTEKFNKKDRYNYVKKSEFDEHVQSSYRVAGSVAKDWIRNHEREVHKLQRQEVMVPIEEVKK